MKLTFKPLTGATWPDLELLFGEKGACGGCWCMYWRRSRSEFNATKGAGNKRALRSLVRAAKPLGVLAYSGREPIGWCAVAPRTEYPTLSRSRILAPLDDKPVWSVTCLFVAKPYRRSGVTSHLIDAAAAFARRNGARLIEAYPIEPKGPFPDVFAFTGIASSYLHAGFQEAARRSPTRPILRRALR